MANNSRVAKEVSMKSESERWLAKAKRSKVKQDLVEAKLFFEKYLALHPKDNRANLDLAEIYMQLELFESASKVYAKLLEDDPKQPVVLSNLGAALLRLGQVDEAFDILSYCLELDPRMIYARINLGGVLQGKERFKEALENALEAVSIDPTHTLAFNNLGSAFTDLSMYSEAKHAFETAAMLDPLSVDTLLNLAGCESKMGNHQSALVIYERVLGLLGPHQKARAESVHFYKCFEHQVLGDLDKHWDGYEYGFSPLIPKTGARAPNRRFSVPKWTGSEVPQKALLIWREQGVGDEFLFASVLPEIESLGIKVIFECDPRLVSVWQRSFPSFEVREYTFDANTMTSPYSDFDFHLPICSLGSLFRRTSESFENFRPFTKPRPDLVEEYKEKLQAIADGRPKVGVLWRSLKLTPNRAVGYTQPDDWDGILNRRDLCFINLQYNLQEFEVELIEAKFGKVLHVFDEINLKDDFERTVALVSNLDFVISPDTTMFEIAGSLGIRTLLMTVHPHGYFGRRDKFIFYPSVDLVTANTFNPNSALEALQHTKVRLIDIFGADESR